MGDGIRPPVWSPRRRRTRRTPGPLNPEITAKRRGASAVWNPALGGRVSPDCAGNLANENSWAGHFSRETGASHDSHASEGTVRMGYDAVVHRLRTRHPPHRGRWTGMVGWVILPIGVAITTWVLFR